MILQLPPTSEELARLLHPWRQIAGKADAFFQRTAERYPDQLRCQPGCDACCRQDLSLSLVEALAVLAAWSGLDSSPPQRAPTPCCAFLFEGRCAIYASRPLICRTHGLMILQRDSLDPGDVPRLSVCPENFKGGPPPADRILDGALLATSLAVADGMARQALGAPPEQRYAISLLAARGWLALSDLPRAPLVGGQPGC